MVAPLLSLLRAAIPFMATLFGGYFLSDVYNERQASKQAQVSADYPALITNTFKRNPAKWKFLAIGGLIVGAIIAFISSKFTKNRR